jgi:hypothetical protein
MIEGRLGWVYQLIDQVTVIIQEAKLILVLSDNTIKAALDLYRNAKEIINLTQYLINGPISNFTQAWERGFYKIRIQNIIDDLEYIIDTVPAIKDLIIQTIEDSTNFVNWLESNPWTHDVYVYGSVKKLNGLATSPIEGVSISSRGETTVTNEDGNFSLMVSVDDVSLDSLPPNSWYGLHNCTVIAEKDGEAKKTTIPYVFSGGEISKVFFFKEDDNDKEDSKNIKTKDIYVIQKLCSLFSFFFHSFFSKF